MGIMSSLARVVGRGASEQKSIRLTDPEALALFGVLPATSGASVTAASALRVPAVRRAVSLIAESVATLPFKTYSTDKAAAKDHPSYALVHDWANDWTSAEDLRELLTADTGHGDKFEPAGVVHKGEFVFSKETVKRLGADNLARLHQSARRGYASGGLVGETGKVARATSARSMDSAKAPAPVVTINAPVTVNASGGDAMQNADLAKQIASEMDVTMRTVVQQELQRQMRPGAMLNRGRV